MTRMHVMSVTPFDGDGQLDETALRRHLQSLAQAGVGVFLASYGTGEGRMLTRDELRRLYTIGVEELGGRVPCVAAGLGLTQTDLVIEMAHEAHALGVDAVQIHPPLGGPATIAPRPGEIDQFYRDVLGAVTTPVVVSNEVLMVGYGLAPERMHDLVERYPQIHSINWTDPDPGSLAHLMELIGDRVPVRVGLTGQLPIALLLGAEGGVSFEANVAPEFCVAVTDAFTRGDLADFRTRLAGLMRLNRILGRYMTPRSVKVALEILGHTGTGLRPPYLGLEPDAYTDIEGTLRELEILG